MRRNSFSKEEHLKRNSSIKYVFDKGISIRSKSINIYLLEKDTKPQIKKAAFIVRKNLYNKSKVLRNRFRRILREAYRRIKNTLPGNYEIVILAKRLHKNTKSTEIERELENVFKKFSKSV